MPSVISRDDLRAKLYSSGITDPKRISEMMRLIDVYAIQVARKNGDSRDEDIPDVAVPAFTPLAPGEWSIALGVTCCLGCTKVRRWDDFHVDKRHSTGHKVVCKDCRKPLEDPDAEKTVRRGGWLCPACGMRKTPMEFPLEKRAAPRKNINCLECSS